MMMMEKPKEEEEKKEAPSSQQTSIKNTNDEILDLERRLDRLGSSEKPKPVQNNALLVSIQS